MNDAKRLFHFTSYRDYLQNLYDSRNRKNPSYSMRKFCKDFGFSSPSHLQDVIVGKKNLGQRGARNITNILKFDQNERDYFHALLALDQPGQTENHRSFLRQRDSVSLDAFLKKIEGKPYEQRRICTVILALLKQYGSEFRADPVWILRRSLLKITPDSVKMELNYLLKEKIIVKSLEGCLLPAGDERGEKTATETEKVSRSDQLNFLQESADLLSSQVGPRHFSNSNFVLDEEDLILLEEKIDEFRKRLQAWVYHSRERKKGGVGVTLNMQLYSITAGRGGKLSQ